jgi:FKBP-type peptidyl-prolyl cis-trans isomerase (trigger factor)
MTEHVNIERDESAWETIIKAEIPAEKMAIYRDEELKELQKNAKMDGFRPGKVPIERILTIYGEPQILRMAAERAIHKELPDLLAKENIFLLEPPKVETQTPEAGKPLAFTARAALPPEVKLPDWGAIAKKHNEKRQEVVISEDEFTQAQVHIRRERARVEKMEQGEEPAKAVESSKATPESDLPPIDDEFAKSIGYDSSAHFAEVLRKNMQTEKEGQDRQVRRNAILDDILKESTVRYPTSMKEYELDDMEGRIEYDLSRMGASFEQYLQDLKKTREDLRKEWAEAADKRAKTRLILSEIARAEKVEVDETMLEQELKHAKEHYKDSDENNLRAGISHALRNEKVLELLESQ